jgi:hypothetical protein
MGLTALIEANFDNFLAVPESFMRSVATSLLMTYLVDRSAQPGCYKNTPD